jgi:hypothetical protein
MPAGSGPQVTRVTNVNVAAAEVAVATITGTWQEVLGTLLSASVNFTPGTGQTSTTLRFRQGNGTGGTLVGIAHTVTTVAAAPIELAIEEYDTSAFAQSSGLDQFGRPTPQTYTLTAQTNAAGPGTINAALVELETAAPVS